MTGHGSYYHSRTNMHTSAPMVETSSSPRPVRPADVYPPSSQMQSSHTASPQGNLNPPAQEQGAKPANEPSSTQADPLPVAPAEPAAQVVDETRENKGKCKPIEPEASKRYSRKFILSLQFVAASMQKPERMLCLRDVILDKAPGPHPSKQAPLEEPRKIIHCLSLNKDTQLHKAERAWKPPVKEYTLKRGMEGEDSEQVETENLFKQLCSILNKITPEKFEDLMEEVAELNIDTEDRLKGVIDLIYEKAISEPNFAVLYAKMCYCLIGLSVSKQGKPGVFVNFHKVLLNRCQNEFAKDQDDDEIFENNRKELEAATDEEEHECLMIEQEEAKDKARRRSLGNIKFIGELFKLKMVTEVVVHNCLMRLLKDYNEESLEGLCKLLSTIGKDLATPHMHRYLNQMNKIIKERKTSFRIRFMLQDVLDLSNNNWVPRRGDQGPKMITRIHNESEMKEQRKGIKVQQQLQSKKDGGRTERNMGDRSPNSRGGGRTNQPQDEEWNTVLMSKNGPIKANTTPPPLVAQTRPVNFGYDFTPSFLKNPGSISMGPQVSAPGPHPSKQAPLEEPRKIIHCLSLNKDTQLHKAERAWKPSVKEYTLKRGMEGEDSEQVETENLFKQLCSILNKITPEKFEDLMKKVAELNIDTEDRLKGVIDLIYEKAISEPNFAVLYAKMCYCLIGLSVSKQGKPGVFVNFHKVLLNRCQNEFAKDQDDDEIFEKNRKELEAATDEEERECLMIKQEEAKDKARRRSLGNIKFIGELFKLKMVTEVVVHNCLMRLLQDYNEESLEGLCKLLSTIGKHLATPHMHQYLNQMNKIIKERKTSFRIRFMLQDVLDLSNNNWVPRRGDQGPKMITRIHNESEMKEQRKGIKVQQQLQSKKDGGRTERNMGDRSPNSRGGGRTNQPQDEEWNTVLMSKNGPIKANTTPPPLVAQTRPVNFGYDFTPSFLKNPGSISMGPQVSAPGPHPSKQAPLEEPRKIIHCLSLNKDTQLHKAERAWKPPVKEYTLKRGMEGEDSEQVETENLFKQLCSILNKITPEKFEDLMKKVAELNIDTEDRLKGVIDLIYEKAISEPNFAVLYAKMCYCLIGLSVSKQGKPGVFVNFHKVLLNRCQNEFAKDQDDDEIFEKNRKELEAATDEEERECLMIKQEEAKDKARRRSLGNIKFIGELFKLKMVTEVVVHNCLMRLLQDYNEESLEGLCKLLSTIGKHLATPHMHRYLNQMNKIIKERKTSFRIRFMLQDVLDLSNNNWVPRRGDQGPKMITRIHNESEMKEQRKGVKVQQQLQSKKDGGRTERNMGDRSPNSLGGGRTNQPQDEEWNTVLMSKNGPIKANTTPPPLVAQTRPVNFGYDFTPSFLKNPGSISMGPQVSAPGPHPSKQAPLEEPRKIIHCLSLNKDTQLHKAERAWKPPVKEYTLKRGMEGEDSEQVETENLFKQLCSILNKITPEKFEDLMEEVAELNIDTEDRLKGVIDLICEKAISEPNFAVLYAKMCYCLMEELSVSNQGKPGVFVNFHKVLLNRCQSEFTKDQDDDEIFEKNRKELEAATDEEERECLMIEQEEAKDKARRRSLGNNRLIGELFKLKMVTEVVVHYCSVKLLNRDRMERNMGDRSPYSRGGGRTNQPQDEEWNTVLMSKNGPIKGTTVQETSSASVNQEEELDDDSTDLIGRDEFEVEEKLQQQRLDDSPEKLTEQNLDEPAEKPEEQHLDDSLEKLTEQNLDEPAEKPEEQHLDESPEKFQEQNLNECPEKPEEQHLDESPEKLQEQNLNESPEKLQQQNLDESPEKPEEQHLYESPEKLQGQHLDESPEKLQEQNLNESPEKPEEQHLDESPEKPEEQHLDESPEKPEEQNLDESPEKPEEQHLDESPEKLQEQHLDESPEKLQEPNLNESPEKPEEQHLDESPEKPEEQNLNESPEKPEEQHLDESPEKLQEQNLNESPEKPEEQNLDESPEKLQEQNLNESPEKPEEQHLDESPEKLQEQHLDESPEKLQEENLNESPEKLQQQTLDDSLENLEEQKVDESSEGAEPPDLIPTVPASSGRWKKVLKRIRKFLKRIASCCSCSCSPRVED